MARFKGLSNFKGKIMILRVLVILIVSCLFFPISTFATIDINENWSESFGGIKWGTRISVLKDMEYIKKWGVRYGKADLIYKIKGDTFDIKLMDNSSIKADDIEYYFWNDRFWKASIVFYEENNKIKDALSIKYGLIKNGIAGRFIGGTTKVDIDCYIDKVTAIFINNKDISQTKWQYERNMQENTNSVWWGIRDFFQEFPVIGFIIGCIALLLLYKGIKIVNRYM